MYSRNTKITMLSDHQKSEFMILFIRGLVYYIQKIQKNKKEEEAANDVSN